MLRSPVSQGILQTYMKQTKEHLDSEQQFWLHIKQETLLGFQPTTISAVESIAPSVLSKERYWEKYAEKWC